MAKALVKLVYRQVIDASSAGDIERNIFHASYDEFLMKSQAYNPEGRFKTFTDLKANDGRANSLHYKISFGAGHFVDFFKNRIPELTDSMGHAVEFAEAKFELLESDITDRSVHRLAINYTTDTLSLINIIGEYLLLAKGKITPGEPVDTFILKMQPNLTISEYQQLRLEERPMHINDN